VSRWFRFYADALRNPKVLRLSDKDFRLWVRLLAVASENDGHIAPLADLKMVLAMRLDHVEGGLQRLISGGLIDALADGYEPHGWAKFQYKSDVSTDRVHKHRAKRNVSETPPDTETDTEKVVVPSGTTPRKRSSGWRIKPDWMPSPLPGNVAALVAQWPDGREVRELDGFRDYWTARVRNAAHSDWDRVWHNRIRDIHDRVLRDTRNGNRTDLRPSAGSRGERRNPLLDLVRATEDRIFRG
jgi:hypothetical protein